MFKINNGCPIYLEWVRLSERRPIEGHAYVFPKKKWQVSSPGRATPTQKYKKRGRGSFLHPKNSPPPPSFKSNTHGIHEFAALGSPFFVFFDSVLRFYSSPTSKYLILEFSSFPLMYFGLLLVGICSNMWGNFGFVSCFIGLS